VKNCKNVKKNLMKITGLDGQPKEGIIIITDYECQELSCKFFNKKILALDFEKINPQCLLQKNGST
jgi:hypothetical protein